MELKPFQIIHLDISDYQLKILNDVLRMFILQMAVQVFVYLRHDGVELFSQLFLENTLFIVLGLIVYWVIFNNVILFSNSPDKEIKLSNYYQSSYNHLKDYQVDSDKQSK